MTEASLGSVEPIGRKIFPLWIGIVLMPGIFVWFLLRKGHSRQERLIGFGWLAVAVIILLLRSTVTIGTNLQSQRQPVATAQQVLDQCNLDGAASNPTPGLSQGLASGGYLQVCMRAHGWVLRADDETCRPPDALYNYAPCYARAADQG